MNSAATPDKPDKAIRWVGSSFDDLCAFPFEPKKKAGFQLRKVQAGIEPDDWKPFDGVGAGVREIRYRSVLHARKETR
jgi:phage-related protein